MTVAQAVTRAPRPAFDATANLAEFDDPAPLAAGVRPIDTALIAYARGFEHPAKIRFVRWLVRRLAGGHILVRHAPGAVVAIDPADYIGWAVFRTGSYEPASLDLARRIMAAEPGWFIDVGANFGWYTCAIAPIAGAKIVSIEPDSANCVALRANIARNRMENVAVVNAAVGAELALAQLVRRAPGNSGTVALRRHDEPAATTGDWVATVPLDSVLRDIVSPSERPVLIKLDIEGFERQALAGLDFAGPFRPKNIILEFEPSFAATGWASLGELTAFFAERGYEARDVFGRLLADHAAVPEANVWVRDRTD